MVEKRADIHRIKDVAAVPDHRPWTGRFRTTGVHEVNRQAVLLPALPRCQQRESILLHGIVFLFLRCMKNASELLTALQGQPLPTQPLPTSRFGHLFRETRVPCIAPIPMLKSHAMKRATQV